MVTILIIRRVCYSECGAGAVAEGMRCTSIICCDGLRMSLRVVLRQIQDSAKVTLFLYHIRMKSLGLRCEALPVLSKRVSFLGSCEYTSSTSRESSGCTVVRKANNMQHCHRCACICGSMKAYRCESASSIHDGQRQNA